MDQLKYDAFSQSIQVQPISAPNPNPSSNPNPNPPYLVDVGQSPLDSRLPFNRLQPSSSQRPDIDTKNCISARKLQKADREKLRRDRLNEQFVELGNILDPGRPKNDKATILTDTIQLLNDLAAQVNKLKAEYATLTEESRELTQEKNDLREEKTSLKSDIESLNAQYQQRLRAMFPWTAMDHSVMMAPPSYPFPMPVAMPSATIPMHPSMQPYAFFGGQNPGVLPNPCSTFVPYVAPNTLVEQQSAQYACPVPPGGMSSQAGKQESRNKSSGESKIEKTENSNEVTTDLELKTPGSTADQELSSGKKKTRRSSKKENDVTEGSASSGCSSSRSVQDSSSNSVVGGTKTAN